jgi:fucose 4-O-acetylase-like acetyltransferase
LRCVQPTMNSSTLTPVSPSPPAKSVAPRRDIVIDVVRGISIVLVALGHTNLGVLHRGWWGTSNAGVRLSLAIYAFHMPAFFFVSGVFLRPGVEKRGVKHYTVAKLRTMIYPYLLWAAIFAAAPIPFARFTSQTPPGWHKFLLDLITGNTFWFLPTLFFALMLGMLMRRIPMPLLFVLSAIACLYVPHTAVGFLERGIRDFPFLVAGMWVGGTVTRIQRVPATLAAFLATICAVVIFVITGEPYGWSGYLFIPLGLLGTLMLLLLARCLGSSTTARALAWTGAASFGIFLLSSFPQGAGRVFLTWAFHVTAPWPQLIFPTLLAVLIPAWLYHRRTRLHIEWMFIWPF